MESITLHLFTDAPEILEDPGGGQEEADLLHQLNFQRFGGELFQNARALQRLILVPGQDSPECWEMIAGAPCLRSIPVSEAF